MDTLLFYATKQERDAVLTAIEQAKVDGVSTQSLAMPAGVDPELPKGGEGILVQAASVLGRHAVLGAVRRAEVSGPRRLAVTTLLRRCLDAGRYEPLSVVTFDPTPPQVQQLQDFRSEVARIRRVAFGPFFPPAEEPAAIENPPES